MIQYNQDHHISQVLFLLSDEQNYTSLSLSLQRAFSRDI